METAEESPHQSIDVLFLGAGLWSCLMACKLLETQPHLRITVLEQSEDPSAHRRTWSFHQSDLDVNQLPPEWMDEFKPLKWPGYQINFPARKRRLSIGYRMISSDSFYQKARKLLGNNLITNAAVSEVSENRVLLKSGKSYHAPLILDGRGLSNHSYPRGYQKFLGLQIKVKEGHNQQEPILMDVTVPQHDGFRFVYTLPLDDKRLLVEDTYYANGPELDMKTLQQGIEAYCHRQGWQDFEIEDQESGVLPIPLWSKDSWLKETAIEGQSLTHVPIGMRAGMFHPTTGYSIVAAMTSAYWLTQQDFSEPQAVAVALRRRQQEMWEKGAYYRRLNNMLFLAGDASTRYQVLQKFYGHPVDFIGRFYGQRLKWFDKLMMLTGKPPVPLLAGLAAFFSPMREAYELPSIK